MRVDVVPGSGDGHAQTSQVLDDRRHVPLCNGHNDRYRSTGCLLRLLLLARLLWRTKLLLQHCFAGLLTSPCAWGLAVSPSVITGACQQCLTHQDRSMQACQRSDLMHQICQPPYVPCQDCGSLHLLRLQACVTEEIVFMCAIHLRGCQNL